MELRHHGILGQKWGVRNGPPYPLSGGDYTPSQRKAISNKRKSGNSIYNKKHFDEVLKVDKTTLSTLSYDKDRTKNADMFYATHHALDKHQYTPIIATTPCSTGRFPRRSMIRMERRSAQVRS